MRSTKVTKRTHREVTELSGELKSKLRNAEYLYNSLSAGSKNRLRQYQTNLKVTRGANFVEFDKSIKTLLSKYVWPDIHMSSEIHYLDSLVDDDGVRFSRNYKLYSKIDEQMLRFTSKPHTSFRWNSNYQLALTELRKDFSKLRLRPLNYGSDDDIIKALPKLDTHSGYTYIESGCKEKGDNMEGILERYKTAVSDALRDGSFNRPIMISFRTQASGEYDDHGKRTGKCKHKTRVVSMCDLMLLIAELRFMAPIQKEMALLPWYTGGKDRNQISAEISDGKAKYNYWTSIDYSSFDQTLPPWLIEDVWNTFAEAFVMSDEDKKLLQIVIKDTINKDFILDCGLAHSEVGLPSGYNFTNAGGSACNRVVWLTYCFAKSMETRMLACGDDNLIFTKKAVDVEDLASYVYKNFGMIINPDKTDKGRSVVDAPKFLSCEWRNDGQFRHPKLLLSRLLYPERHREYSGNTTPELVLYAYILTYQRGMEKLMNINAFMRDNPKLRSINVFNILDSRHLPGAIAFMRDYLNPSKVNKRRNHG